LLSSDLLRLPPGWDLIVGADTGTFMSAVFVGVSPEPFTAYALAEIPNYTYVAGEYELLGLTIPEWAAQVTSLYRRLVPGRKPHGWCDPNSQFKTELAHYGLILQGNHRGEELRTEITREYFTQDRIRLAPWLEVLPYEIENASWPPETSASGKFKRLKEKDHTLDCLEHALSRRPRTRRLLKSERPSLVQQHLARHAIRTGRRADTHLGTL
jgi:hypothetical protein